MTDKAKRILFKMPEHLKGSSYPFITLEESRKRRTPKPKRKGPPEPLQATV